MINNIRVDCNSPSKKNNKFNTPNITYNIKSVTMGWKYPYIEDRWWIYWIKNNDENIV